MIDAYILWGQKIEPSNKSYKAFSVNFQLPILKQSSSKSSIYYNYI